MSDVTNYLRNETAKAQRNLRVALVAMGVVLVAFIAYFEWLKKELASVLTPESVAELAVNEARRALPAMSEALKSNIRDEAPNVVRFVLQLAVDETLPLLGETFDTHLRDYSFDISEITTQHSQPALSAVLKRYAAEHKSGKNKARPISAAHLATVIEAQLQNELSTSSKPAMAEKLAETSSTLKHINSELVAMAGTRKLNREDELGRRLITTWWTFLDRGRAPIPGEERAGDAAAR